MKRFFKSFTYAFEGIADLFKNTSNARFHLLAAILVLLAGWYYSISPMEWSILILCIGLVFGFEALNSSLEYLTDLASPEIHPLAKKAKDMAAGAVLIIAICTVVVSFFIILPKIIG